MSQADDPFRHHPELRGLITDPAQSYFRNFSPAEFDKVARANGMPEDWRYPDEVRNRLLHDFIAGLPAGDLWVFAYGSLMWDPGAYFAEIRKAYAPAFERKFILCDRGARGTKDNPAVMAALDTGTGCHGIVLRIGADQIATELEIIWRRERIATHYNAEMIDVKTECGNVCALTFIANHADPDIHPGLTFDDQVSALATAKGAIGTNYEYIDNLKRHFDTLAIHDPSVDELYGAATALARAKGLLG